MIQPVIKNLPTDKLTIPELVIVAGIVFLLSPLGLLIIGIIYGKIMEFRE